MAKIKINVERCKGCELCIIYCPKNLIDVSRHLNIRGVHPAVFKKQAQSKCVGCAFCAQVCPEVCIEVYG